MVVADSAGPNLLADARKAGRRRRQSRKLLSPPEPKLGEGGRGGGGGGGVEPDGEDVRSKQATNETRKIQMKKKRDRPPDDALPAAALRALWHKKTGGGYRLFASYYLRQPPGLVVAGDEDDVDDVAVDDDDAVEAATKENKTGTGSELSMSSKQQASVPEESRGMSRASVRRRRNNNKRRRVLTGGSADETAAGDTIAATTATTTATAAAADPPPPPAPPDEPRGNKDGAGATEDRRRRLAPHRVAADASVISGRHGTTNDDDDLLPHHPLLGALRDLTSQEKEEAEADTICRRSGGSGPHRCHQHNHGAFFRALARPLPVSFRIRRGVEAERERLLRSDLQGFVEAAGVLRPVPGLSGIDSSAAPLVYQSTPASATGATAISNANLKAACPELKRFLNDWCLRGGIARQEVGSMLPVLLLQSAGHLPGGPRQQKEWGGVRVLDLCASPGSKTLQAAELLLLLGRGAATMVRANDVHPQRLEALRDAVRRSGIPRVESVLKYSQIDATQFPVPASESKKYDVVICDVPCSGDGTCRKDRHILPNWTPRVGNALHPTQLRILKRALRLVPVGGAVSYSTCSLNPVENEAVVSAAMAQAAAEVSTSRFELVRLPPLEGFVLRPGVSTWKVADSVTLESDEESEGQVLRWHERYEDAVRAGMDDAVPTLWPPDLLTLHLDRCRRLLPQDQDTGGFFVAIIRRVA